MISAYTAEEIIQKRNEISTKVIAAINAIVPKKGNEPLVFLDNIAIQETEFSEELNKAIESKQVAQQHAEAKKYEVQGSRLEAEKTVITAKAQAESMHIKAEAIKQSPSSVAITFIEKWNGQLPDVLVTDPKSNQILNLK